jgi:hypothetical protein
MELIEKLYFYCVETSIPAVEIMDGEVWINSEHSNFNLSGIRASGFDEDEYKEAIGQLLEEGGEVEENNTNIKVTSSSKYMTEDNISNIQTVSDLLDIIQELTDLFDKYGLEVPKPILERLVQITKTFTELNGVLEKSEQTIHETSSATQS